ncbi:hypothetical protein B0H10DRAFT_1974944 [Mycena sp. CBHHK59/15]|nr:hypothetical protein B0H10DRAFT_1974944 [Mycena sp. CBHHK59/15]
MTETETELPKASVTPAPKEEPKKSCERKFKIRKIDATASKKLDGPIQNGSTRSAAWKLGAPGSSGDEDEAQKHHNRSNAPKSKARLKGKSKRRPKHYKRVVRQKRGEGRRAERDSSSRVLECHPDLLAQMTNKTELALAALKSLHEVKLPLPNSAKNVTFSVMEKHIDRVSSMFDTLDKLKFSVSVELQPLTSSETAANTAQAAGGSTSLQRYCHDHKSTTHNTEDWKVLKAAEQRGKGKKAKKGKEAKVTNKEQANPAHDGDSDSNESAHVATVSSGIYKKISANVA